MLRYSLFLLIALFIMGCEKDQIEFLPESDFYVNGKSDNNLKVASLDSFVVVHSVDQHFAGYHWDFGDGQTSNKKTIRHAYGASGIYQISLTITDSKGKTSTTTKTLIVLDRVLKRIELTYVYWDTIPNNIPYYNYRWPTSSTADVFLQIQQNTGCEMKLLGIWPECPVLFTSSMGKNVYCNTTTSIEIPVKTRFVISKELFSPFKYGNYIINLLAKDGSGEIYNLATNLGGGSYLDIMSEDISQNYSIIQGGLTSSYLLHCSFE